MTEPKWTPGPWGWFGSTRTGVYLATRHSGRRYVMDFVRKGFNGCEPRFQPGTDGMKTATELAIFEVCRDATDEKDPRVYRTDVVGFRAADAHLIAAAPDMAEALEAFVEFAVPELIEEGCRGKSDPGCPSCMAIEIVDRARSALARARGEA